MITALGFLYSWATPDYLLQQMTLPQISLYYLKGVEREQLRGERYGRESAVRVACYMVGKNYDKDLEEERKKEKELTKAKKRKGPDLKKFESLYKDRIKRPPR